MISGNGEFGMTTVTLDGRFPNVQFGGISGRTFPGRMGRKRYGSIRESMIPNDRQFPDDRTMGHGTEIVSYLKLFQAKVKVIPLTRCVHLSTLSTGLQLIPPKLDPPELDCCPLDPK